jgi:Ca2+-binding EF-hand superfamily protein
MASDEQVEQLKQALTQLVDAKFGGDWDRAFQHYASLGGAGGLVDKGELKKILRDAGFIMTGSWAKGIMKEADQDNNKGISWEEFQALLSRD